MLQVWPEGKYRGPSIILLKPVYCFQHMQKPKSEGALKYWGEAIIKKKLAQYLIFDWKEVELKWRPVE